MIAGLLGALALQVIIYLLDPGFWLILARQLRREDMKNSELRTWERLGL